MPQRITLILTPKPSNTLYWACSEQVFYLNLTLTNVHIGLLIYKLIANYRCWLLCKYQKIKPDWMRKLYSILWIILWKWNVLRISPLTIADHNNVMLFWCYLCFYITGYVAYFITACVLDFERATALVVLTSLAVVAKAYDLVKTYHGDNITKCFIPAQRCFNNFRRWIIG